MINKRIMSLNEFANLQEKKDKREDKKIKSDYDFIEYAKEVLKDAHGDNYDERKAEETIEGILKKADGDYEKAIGILQSGLGD